mgnify:CR=1 FL=1
MKKRYEAPVTETIVVQLSLMKQFASGWNVDGNKEGEVEEPDAGNIWGSGGSGGSSGGLGWGDND